MKRPLLPNLALLLSLGLTSCTINYYGLDPNQAAAQHPPRHGGYPTRNPNGTPTGGGQTGGIKTPPPAGGSGSGPMGVKPPVREQGSGGGVKTPDTWQTGGIKPPPAGGGGSPVGIKPPEKDKQKEPVKDPEKWETGGIKPPPAGGGSPVGIRPPEKDKQKEPVKDAEKWETGGIKPPPASGGGSPVGIKPPEKDKQEEPVKDSEKWETGGIKPPPPARDPVGIKPPADSGKDEVKESDSWQTGGIKPPPGGGVGAGPGETAGAEPVLTFAKTPCLGPCPEYTATIWADGRVSYVGTQHVGRVGTYQLQLPAETVQELLREARKIGFSSFKNHYGSGAADLPSTILTIRQDDGSSKTVQAEDNVPEALQELFSHVSQELDAIAGIETKSAR